MAAVFVVVLSLVAGIATYVATIRSGRRIPAAVGFESRSTAAVAAVGLGSEPVPAPPTLDEDERDAEIVELDPARATPDEVDASYTSDADTLESDDAAEGTIERAAMPLAPVIVTAATVPAPEPGYSYLRVSTGRPSWRDRVAGIIGIAILLVVGSAAIAFGIYQLGSAINALVQRFLNG